MPVYMVYVYLMHTTSPASRILNPVHPGMRSGRVSASAVKGYLSTMRFLGYALAAVVVVLVLAANSRPAESNRSSDIDVPAPTPHWNGIYAKTFPGCVGSGDFIAARIVVVPREGAARTMRYSDATVAHINATWNNDDRADDLYTIGKCAR